MNQFIKIKELLHGSNDIYENFNHLEYENTLSPGSMPANELLQKIVEEQNPSLIIEVGSFLGWSAWGMGLKMKQLNPDGVIICVDTWMGGPDHWEEAAFKPNPRIKRKNGYPTFYYNFLANMKYTEMDTTIIPFAYPSSTGASILKKALLPLDIQADMIYVDASHEAMDVYFDCAHYWPLLKKGGVMFGDDWTNAEVRWGVEEFCKNYNFPPPEVNPNLVHWFIRKVI